MLQLKRCKFCRTKFRSQDAGDREYCAQCSNDRRRLAGEEFRAESGRSLVFGNYLLSQRQASRFGVRPQ
jgi:hypothetical protein